jgi:hypothetical protein
MLALLELAQQDVREKHGDFQGATLCVLGMGKLGSRELTASSDLDLLLIYNLPEGQPKATGSAPSPPRNTTPASPSGSSRRSAPRLPKACSMSSICACAPPAMPARWPPA